MEILVFIGLMILLPILWVLPRALDAARDEGDDDVAAPTPKKKKPDKGLGFAVSARMKIRYIGADDEESEREIHAHHYVDSSPGYIKARCKKAKAERSFRTDRIKDAVDMETGEIIKRIPTFMRSKRIE